MLDLIKNGMYERMLFRYVGYLEALKDNNLPTDNVILKIRRDNGDEFLEDVLLTIEERAYQSSREN